MEHASTEKKPEILVFAGPNGSGKTTVTRLATLVGVYVNADEIKNALNCSALEAACVNVSLYSRPRNADSGKTLWLHINSIVYKNSFALSGLIKCFLSSRLL